MTRCGIARSIPDFCANVRIGCAGSGSNAVRIENRNILRRICRLSASRNFYERAVTAGAQTSGLTRVDYRRFCSGVHSGATRRLPRAGDRYEHSWESQIRAGGDFCHRDFVGWLHGVRHRADVAARRRPAGIRRAGPGAETPRTKAATSAATAARKTVGSPDDAASAPATRQAVARKAAAARKAVGSSHDSAGAGATTTARKARISPTLAPVSQSPTWVSTSAVQLASRR
jgi:hypothetical protein